MKSRKASQKDQIYQYMKEFGSITSLDAIRAFGCTRLSGRIYDLRRDGINITKSMETVKTRDGGTTTVAVYRLGEE